MCRNKKSFVMEAEKIKISEQIKARFAELKDSDGLKRTQRWLATQTGIGEVDFSIKMNKDSFTESDLEKINSVLNTNFKA